ncbi:iron-containing alcohol dehydrogenase [Gellertiella hungarica]|uniref:Alcohol dehydrogenase class IV n=1 Tax=Gellertiella hungarica TaxID=1572859 RepID=A0A7W6J5J7_9HYPH|nr:iron-containing alcohol dehydrogenase [Gellertiella hungarica]MBB4065201.1 alcohol dehydrogenase class IV [Gellertiella hungarica]
MQFSTSFIPEIRFAPGAADQIAAAALAMSEGGKTAIVMDGFLAASGLGNRLMAELKAGGAEAVVYSGFSGEPKLAHVEAASEAARGADVVIGIGGGSALDIAKVAACCAASGENPMHYALAANPLPKNALKKILVPTTAGTGSETSATCIFAGPDGKKLWVWGAETKADLVILDPALTTSLPANLTAWCGLDAFVHAFEASTNRNTHAGGQFYGHRAMELLVAHLETAIREPDNLEARGAVLLGSCYAGVAIDNCGTAIAHNISHALAGLGPVHHGLATALGFEQTLPWLVGANTPELQAAAKACGAADAASLPALITAWMDRCGFERRLPAAFAGLTAEDLAREMKAPENQPMRRSTVREVSDADVDRMAADMMALPRA